MGARDGRPKAAFRSGCPLHKIAGYLAEDRYGKGNKG